MHTVHCVILLADIWVVEITCPEMKLFAAEAGRSYQRNPLDRWPVVDLDYQFSFDLIPNFNPQALNLFLTASQCDLLMVSSFLNTEGTHLPLLHVIKEES